MKRMLVLIAFVVSGCSMFKTAMPPEPVVASAAASTDAPVQTIAFVTGVSSVTVENMAKAQSCRGGQGAGLVTPAGPVEVYRMRCDNGRVFMARCELRQCRQM
jgi:hypothetical protein